MAKEQNNQQVVRILSHHTLLPLLEDLVKEMVLLLDHHQEQVHHQEMEEKTKMADQLLAGLLLVQHPCHRLLQEHNLVQQQLPWLECLEA